MKICVSSPSYLVLVNGSSKGFFKGSRGLRQGDSLPPYLFIIVVEFLSRLLSKADISVLMASFAS